MITEGERLGVLNEAALVAGILSERDIRLDARSRLHRESKPVGFTRATCRSDLVEILDLLHQAREARFDTDRLSDLGLDPRAVQAVERTRRQITRLAAEPSARHDHQDPWEHEEGILIAILAGFPDRVAKRRMRGSIEFICSAGGSAPGLTCQ